MSSLNNNDKTKVKQEAVFRECEYDIIEKRLLALQDEMSLEKSNEASKELCDIGVVCENRWAELFCRDNKKPIDENKEEALSVLKYNLEVRRKGMEKMKKIHELEKMKRSLAPAETKPSSSLPIETNSSSLIPVEIKPSSSTPVETKPRSSTGYFAPLGLNVVNPNSSIKKSSSGSYAVCFQLPNLSSSPLYSYSCLPLDACFHIENSLFSVETKMKKMEDTESQEYHNLIEEGKKLRLEWKRVAAEISISKSHLFNDYDLDKCLTKTKGSRKAA